MLINFKEAKQLVKIAEVIDILGIQINRRTGPQLRGKCPFHQSGNPKSISLAIHTVRNAWFCHMCKIGGDQFDLYAKTRHTTVYEAAIELCRRCAGRVPELPSSKEHRRGTVIGGSNNGEN